jgi:4-phytase/acid phosphatase
MLDALRAPDSALVTLLAGHDTNIADLAGLLNLHWRVPSYAKDTVPPGSALGFELLSDASGDRFVRAFYRSQDMDQLRKLQALTEAKPAHRSYLDIPGCARAGEARGCRLDAFARLVEARLKTESD